MLSSLQLQQRLHCNPMGQLSELNSYAIMTDRLRLLSEVSHSVILSTTCKMFQRDMQKSRLRGKSPSEISREMSCCRNSVSR